MDFKDNLKKIRELSGFTRVEMANQLNMTPAAYGAYELGKREPKFTKLCEIAELLHTSIDELLGYVPQNMRTAFSISIAILGQVYRKA